MNYKLLNTEVQNFIRDHLNDDVSKILFAKSPFEGVSVKELAEQIESKRSSEKKLPTWFKTEGIYYPPKLSIEQTSSEQTAAYKANFAKGEKLIDLTGGFGVDSFFFSKVVKSVMHCEVKDELSTISKHNASVLGADNIQFFTGDGISFLKDTDQKFDTIYIDPARRKIDKKVFMLSDCEPDVVNKLDLLLSKADRLIIKTSPLLDIQFGLNELKNVSQIHVVSVKNDCKELLWILDSCFQGDPEITSVSLDVPVPKSLSFQISEEKELQITKYSDPQLYLYEPDVSLLKAGCFKLITKKFDLEKIAPNTHLYTSEELNEEFIGRIFKVTSCLNYKAFMKQKPVSKANIICRNFPLTPAEIKKKNKLTDGGSEYLIFFRNSGDELLVASAIRV